MIRWDWIAGLLVVRSAGIAAARSHVTVAFGEGMKLITIRDRRQLRAFAAGGATFLGVAAVAAVAGIVARAPRRQTTPPPQLISPSPPEVTVEPVDRMLEIRSRVRRQVAKELIAILIFSCLTVATVGYCFWLALPDSPWQKVDISHVDTWGPRLQKTVSGRITPDQSLAAIIAMLALNATINVALAIPQSVSNIHDQVAIGEWRRWLGLVAHLASVIAVVAAVAAWLGPSVRNTSIISGFAGAAALLCVMLTISIVQATSNAAEREMSRQQTEHEQSQLESRQNMMGIARSERFSGDSASRPIARVVLAAAVRVALIAAVTAACALLVAFIVTTCYYGLGLDLGWNTLRGFFWLTAYGAMLAYCTAWLSYTRWASHRTNHPRLRLYAACWSLRIGYILLACLLVVGLAYRLRDPAIGGSGMLVIIVAMPAVLWAIAGWTKTHRKPAWLYWVAEPLWGAIEASLKRRDAVLRSRL